ncbi:MAG: DNA polymerase I [Clostridiales bacterium]|nr:DNA polymerase I [Clostridiales bacterium]
MRKLMVIDGNSIINRAFYGIRLLSNSEGVYTNALLGFLNILSRLSEEEEPDGVCVCFDLKAPTFRHKLYDGYKAGRRPMPEELAMQLPLLKELLDALRIPRYELAGWEADDLLGTLSKKIQESGDSCVLVTGDRDSLQLVGGNTVLKYVSARQGRPETTLYDEFKINLEFGIEPRQFIDVKSLMGDQSDNIPGVRGIGEKTALELIRKFKTLDGVYENLDSADIRPAVRAKLAAEKDTAYMSLELARIDRNAPIDADLSAISKTPPDNDGLYRLLSRLEINSYIKKLGLTPPPSAPSAADAAARRTPLKLSSPVLLSGLSGEIGFDADFEAPAFAAAQEGTVYVFDPGPFERGAFDSALSDLISSGVKFCCASSKPLMRYCLENGLPSPEISFDASLAALLCEGSADSAAVRQKYLGWLPDSQCSPVADGADGALALRPVLEKIMAERGLDRLYRGTELPLAKVLAEMEHEGFLLDEKALRAFGGELDGLIAHATSEVYSLAGKEFNISSPRQLGTVLFDEMHLPHGKKTKTGWSTNFDVLKKLSDEPIVAAVLSFRAFTKLKSTYVDGLLRAVSPSGRVHTTFSQLGAVTGRLSSSEPNLQNIPVRSEPGSRMREFFIAGEGNVLVDADYSQIELRVLAHMSGDERMIRAFASGEDIHRSTAAQVFGIPPEEVTSRQRTFSKAVNFGIVYGISDFALADDLGISRRDAREMIDRYLENYPGVKKYMSEVVERARNDGFVTTLFGRRRALPDIKASNFNVRSAAERMALNAPIQGTAADIIKFAMVAVARRLSSENLKARLILQVHDELIVECPECEAEKVKNILEEEMTGVADLSVALRADASVGKSWAKAKG